MHRGKKCLQILTLHLGVFTLGISNLDGTSPQALGRIPDKGRVEVSPCLPNLGLKLWQGFGLGVRQDLQC